jgi:hypothetical protein
VVTYLGRKFGSKQVQWALVAKKSTTWISKEVVKWGTHEDFEKIAAQFLDAELK